MIATVFYLVSLRFLTAARVVLVLDPGLFAVLVWGTIALVVVVFTCLLYGVVRAGGIGLSDGGL
jgi:hypothetical protein